MDMIAGMDLPVSGDIKMAERMTQLEKWIQELKKKSHDGLVANKDIMEFISTHNLGEEDLSALYEALHIHQLEVDFNEEVDDSFDFIEEEESAELVKEEEAEAEAEEDTPVPDLDNAISIDDPVKMYLKEIGKVPLLTPGDKHGVKLFAVGSFAEYFFSAGVVFVCYLAHRLILSG